MIWRKGWIAPGWYEEILLLCSVGTSWGSFRACRCCPCPASRPSPYTTTPGPVTAPTDPSSRSESKHYTIGLYIGSDEKAKVVASVWGAEFIQFPAALDIFCPGRFWWIGWINPFFPIILVQYAARNWIHSSPRTEATNLDFSSVFYGLNTLLCVL